jgi:hypothetical protein
MNREPLVCGVVGFVRCGAFWRCKMLNPWLALSFQAARLGWEAQNVMALRLMRFAGGGAAGQSEAHRMVSEKVAALTEAHAAAMTVAIKGGNVPAMAKKIMRVYNKRVRGNKRRLSK